MKIIPKYLSTIEISSDVIYRGHSNKDWELKPSIGRYYTGDWKFVAADERKAFEEFKRLSIPHIKYQPSSDIEWLCLMQHHGCATRLLDFTTNPLIALFFASDPTIPEDGEVVIARYSNKNENIDDVNLFSRIYSFAYYPPHITERIIGQSGCFVYCNQPNQSLNSKQVNRFPVAKKHKFEIRHELKTLGITYSNLFPGLDGICRDLNDSLVGSLEIEELVS